MELRREFLDTADDAETAAWTRAQVQDRPLTILEIATLIADQGRYPTPAVSRGCREEMLLIEEVDPAAIRAELERGLLGRDVDVALEWLLEIGVIEKLLPELAATVNLAQEGDRKHKDVWEHTKLVVRQAPTRAQVRWAALLHDIGKVPTRTFTRNGVHFHGHAEVGARMFDKISRRLGFEDPDRRNIRFLIKHHLRSNQYSDTWTDSAVRRFARDVGEHRHDLLDLSRADCTSRRPGRRRALLDSIDQLDNRISSLEAEDAKLPPLPTGLGTAIMTRFGIPPSRRIGDLKRALEEAVERGELEERREDDYYLDWLVANDMVGAELKPTVED